MLIGLSLLLFGVLGLGIDGAQIYAQRQMAQAAADAAVQSAAMSILRGTNSTSAHPFSTAIPFTCSVPPAALDLRTPCVYAQDNGFGASADTVVVSFPATLVGVTLAAVATPAVSVSVQRVVKTTFMRFFGISSSTISARASAGILSSVPGTCLYVLDPSAPGALSVSNGANVTMNCAVNVNSTSATALSVTGGAILKATAVSVVGGDNINNGGSVTPAPVTGVAATADPFASVAGPSVGACSYTNYSPGWGTWTLNPGVYCGGITINNGATATFNPGMYIVNGGSVNLGGGANITGNGVSFYLTGTNATYGSVTIANGVTVNLAAPTSGTYDGLLFFQNRAITSAVSATFAGGASMKLSGTLYFPTTTVSFSNGVAASATTAIVAKQASFTGGAQIVYDPTGLKTGLFVRTAGLME